MTLETTIERDDITVPVTVEAEYHRPHRGARDSCCGVRNTGPPLEPDEPGYWEITRVFCAIYNHEFRDLTDLEREWIEQELDEML